MAIEIPIVKSNLIQHAVAEGMEFHHTEGSHLVMSQWLDSTRESKLPSYATHYCGVGGFVLNELDEILLIQERNPIFGKPFWKLPGGLVEENEDLEQAVIREVKEETGITATVTGLIGFREVKQFLFNKNDLYFVFLMHANKADSEIVKQEDEIAECEWVTCDEFAEKAPLLSPMLQRIAPIFNANKEIPEKVIDEYRGEKSKEAMIRSMIFTNKQYQFRNRNNNLYLGKFMKDCMRLGSKL